MSNTYTQIHIQAVFAVKRRASLIHKDWKDELYKYITGIIQNHNHKLLAINGIEDHIHIFFGMRTTQSLADLMQDVKGSSSQWINNQKFCNAKFEWQSGFGAFSYSRSHVKSVIKYIEKQEEHHSKKTFLNEYKMMLKKFEVDYNDKYIFKPLI